jgi:glycerol-3-phosphate acyltransferase PlsY
MDSLSSYSIIIKILSIIVAYLLGSIPTSVWIGKYFYNIDVRKHGSKNSGFTNATRVLGIRAGIPVLIIDILKGVVAVRLAHIELFPGIGNLDFVVYEIILGIAALIGHIFPLFAGFNGGKGVATLLGVTLAIVPVPTLMAAGVFIITLLLSKYVSLSSLMAAFAFPFLTILLLNKTHIALIVYSVVVFVVLVFTHQQNIKRLINHQEHKVHLRKPK